MRKFALIAATALGLLACDRVQESRQFYPNGTRKSIENYEHRRGDSLLHGLRTVWYPTGKPESSERFVHGRRQGYAFRWHANGQMQSVQHYTDGEPDGQAIYWDTQDAMVACYDAESGDCLRTAGAVLGESSRLAARP